MKNIHSACIGLVAFLTITIPLSAQTVGWRMDGTGRYPDANPPTAWSQTSNIVWKTKMPSWSNSSPILVEGKIFVLSEPDTLVCVDQNTGDILWQQSHNYPQLLIETGDEKALETQKEIKTLQSQLNDLNKQLQEMKGQPKGDQEKTPILSQQIQEIEQKLEKASESYWPRTNKSTGYSTPTPVSDGESVYAHFGTGVTACYDMQGNRKWIRIVDKPSEASGHSTTPLLIDNKLIIHFTDIVAVNVKTGEEIWRTKSKRHWGTPAHIRIGDEDVIVTTNTEFVRVSDGVILKEKMFEYLFNSPVAQHGAVFIVARHGGRIIKIPSELTDPLQPEVLRNLPPTKIRCFASPLAHEGLVYNVTEKKTLFVFDAVTGDEVYSLPLEIKKGSVYSSITLAGQYVFILGEEGTTLVIRTGRQYSEVARNELEGIRSCPVFQDSRMYLRGMEYLYCIGR